MNCEENNSFGLSDINLDSYRDKIFIGGLSWQSTKEAIEFNFSQYGNVTDVVLLTDKFIGNSRGFGFVTFATEDAVQIALTQENFIDGRFVEVKKAVILANRNAHHEPAISVDSNLKKIFVGGLVTHATKTDVIDYFSKYGLVTDCIIMMDKITGRSRGFGL